MEEKCPICGNELILCHHKGKSLEYPTWSFHCEYCDLMFCMRDWDASKKDLLKILQRAKDKQAIAA